MKRIQIIEGSNRLENSINQLLLKVFWNRKELMVDSDNGQILAAYFLIKCGSSKAFLLLMAWSFTNLYVIFTTVSYYMLYVLEVSRFSYSSTFICYLDLQHITNHLKLTEVCRLRSVIYYLFFSFERYSDCQRKFNF